jgi:Leucine-rich repeat (LRR) protein
VKSLEISSKYDRTITKVTGFHSSGKTNGDVKFFEVRGKVLNYFPRGLEKYFSNLDSIYVFSSDLKEISSEDLKPFRNLKVLYLWDNDIEILRADLFVYTPKISLLYLSKNKIKRVEKGIFHKLFGVLNELDFENNDCYVSYAFTGGVESREESDGKSVKSLYDSISLAKAIEATCG